MLAHANPLVMLMLWLPPLHQVESSAGNLLWSLPQTRNLLTLQDVIGD